MLVINGIKELTGINQKTDNNLSIFLNPVDNILSINGLLKNSQISIFDINGRLIIDKQIINNQIDINSFQNGVYIVRVATEQGYLVQKIIK